MNRHELVDLTPKTQEHLRLIRYLEENYRVRLIITRNEREREYLLIEVDRWSEVLQINRNIRMSFPRRQASKIKKLCKQHGIDITILNSDLNE